MNKKVKWKLPGFLKNYSEFLQTSKYRCKIIGIEKSKEGKNVLLVTISSIKSHLPIKYLPEELVFQNEMLREFSQEDVRAITFCAIQNIEKYSGNAKKKILIKNQEFNSEQTIYILQFDDNNYEIRKTAREIYADTELLSCFELKDVINIVSTAVQEQLIEDLGN